MPLYSYSCPECKHNLRRIVKGAAPVVECPQCGERMRRVSKPPTVQVLEVLDNGAMPKRLERLADAERLYKERDKERKSRE